MPFLAQALEMHFTTLRMTYLYEAMTEELESLDASTDEALQTTLEMLKKDACDEFGIKIVLHVECVGDNREVPSEFGRAWALGVFEASEHVQRSSGLPERRGRKQTEIQERNEEF